MKKHEAQIMCNRQNIGFIKYGVKVFLQNKDVEQAQISNEYGTIILSREIKEATTSHTFGFTLPYSSDEEEYEEDIKDKRSKRK